MSKEKKVRELNEEEIKNVSGGYRRDDRDMDYAICDAKGKVIMKGLSKREAELIEKGLSRKEAALLAGRK